MHELIITEGVSGLASIGETAQLRRRHGSFSSYRKNVCFITLNGSWNGFSFMNCFNGFGGF